MSNTIQPGVIKQLQTLGKTQGSDAAGDADAAGVDRGDRPGVADTGDSVRLTDSAKAIDAASRASQTASAVDVGHVERVRQALANGSYKVDAGRIADKLISMEQQISGKS